MMKKIFAIFIMFFLLVNGVYVSGYCSDSFDGKVDKHQDERLISRSDCLTFVMIAIGTFPYIHESYGGISREEYYNEWSMCDFDSVLVGKDIAEKNMKEFYEKSLFQYFPGCVDIAVTYAKIANGEYVVDDSKNIVYFNLNDKVTLEQALAFMVRCFDEDRYKGKSLDYLFQIAKDKSLLLETDDFFDKPENNLTLSEFRILLERFLNHPKGVYHREGYYASYPFNDEKNETYYENLVKKYGEEFVEWLLSYDGHPQWKGSDDMYTYMSRQGLRNAEKEKRYLDNVTILSDVSELTINSFSIIPSVENHREYVLVLYGTYKNWCSENDGKVDLPLVLQNNTYSSAATYLDNYFGTPDENGLMDIIISYDLQNNIDDVIITYNKSRTGQFLLQIETE